MRHVINLLIVWILTGIWHGAEWTFIIWGLYYFVLQLIEKKTGIDKKIPRCIGWILTLFLVMIGWVIFRASNMQTALQYISCMFGKNFIDVYAVKYAKTSCIIFVIAFVGMFPIFPKMRNMLEAKEKYGSCIWSFFDFVWSTVLLIVSLMIIINGSYSPFIYFNF
jgi:D-alanyl-lipoteichoic acid acyltransferase DltB (MBOAT superfamily)